MSYFDEQEIRKRVVRRVRRRFLFVVHALASPLIGFLIVFFIHRQYMGGYVGENQFAVAWGVGSEYYNRDMLLTCSIIGALFLIHFLWFLYRELVDNALGHEMRFAHQNKVYPNEVATDKLKREEFAHLTDDGELVIPEDLDSDDLSDRTKQWQRN